MSPKTPITVAYGDGIGPEIMDATLRIIEAAGARLEIEDDRDRRECIPPRTHGGNRAPLPGNRSAARRSSSRRRSPPRRAAGSRASTSPSARRSASMPTCGPASSYHPFVDTKHPAMDVVIVRENEEDLYAGHRAPPDRRGRPVPEADLPARLREDRPLRLRIRPRATTARRSPASRKTTS